MQLHPSVPPSDLCAALRQLRSEHDLSGQTLRLGGGIWDLFPEEAPETVIHPANNDCGPARSPFLFEGLREDTIDGQGARLLVRGTPRAGRGSIGVLYPPLVPFILRDCHNITLKNLAIDWATPGTVQGTCIAADPASAKPVVGCKILFWCTRHDIGGPRPLLIEHNTFETPGAAILLESSSHWAEAGPTTDVVIRHNVFQNCGHAPAWGRAVIQAELDFRKDAPSDLPPFHGNITLADNQFSNCHAPETHLESFAGVASPSP